MALALVRPESAQPTLRARQVVHALLAMQERLSEIGAALETSPEPQYREALLGERGDLVGRMRRLLGLPGVMAAVHARVIELDGVSMPFGGSTSGERESLKDLIASV